MTIAVSILAGILALGALVIGVPVLRLYLRARRTGVSVAWGDAVRIRLMSSRIATLERVIDAAIEAKRRGVNVDVHRLHVHTLAGGDPGECVRAIAEARHRGLELAWDGATAADLAGVDLMSAIRAGVSPAKVIGAKQYVGRFQRSRVDGA